MRADFGERCEVLGSVMGVCVKEGASHPVSSFTVPLRATLLWLQAAEGVWQKTRSCIIVPLNQRAALPLLPLLSFSLEFITSAFQICLLVGCTNHSFLSFHFILIIITFVRLSVHLSLSIITLGGCL